MKEHAVLYMLHPGSTETRALVEGEVLQMGCRSTIACFPDLDVALDIGQVLTIYFREDREFQKQEVEVVGIELGSGTELRLDLLPLGEVTSGEGRQSERFSLVYEGMTATFGQAHECPLVDVSETGLALVAGLEFELGQSVRCEMWVDEVCYRGSCTIRSIAAMSGNQWRYGVTCDEDVEGDNLKSSMKRMWDAVRMQQLQMTSR